MHRFLSSHPGVQLDVGAVLRDERAAVCEVGDIGHAADAAGVICGPVVGASLVLVLQGRQLDRLNVQTRIHQLSHSEHTNQSVVIHQLTENRNKRCLIYEVFSFVNNQPQNRC